MTLLVCLVEVSVTLVELPLTCETVTVKLCNSGCLFYLIIAVGNVVGTYQMNTTNLQ